MSHLRQFQLGVHTRGTPASFPALSAFCQSQMKLFEEKKNYFFSSLKMYNPEGK